MAQRPKQSHVHSLESEAKTSCMSCHAVEDEIRMGWLAIKGLFPLFDD